MKKIVLFITVLALVLSWSLVVSANFVPSISVKPAPEIIEATNESGEKIQVALVAYSDIDILPEEAKQIMQEAYDQIAEVNKLSKLNKIIKKLAKEEGVKTTALTVSDFFDLSDADGVVDGEYNITLDVATLNNFLCLLHYTNGEWEVVEATVSENGQNLIFSVDSFSPFAIVAASPAPARNPVPLILWIFIGILVGALIDVIVIFILEKKKKIIPVNTENVVLADGGNTENAVRRDNRSKR